MQYCKTDLIASKGIVFAKYDASSSAYAAMEAVQASGSIAGYRVKVMIAEPKNHDGWPRQDPWARSQRRYNQWVLRRW